MTDELRRILQIINLRLPASWSLVGKESLRERHMRTRVSRVSICGF
jgi:hypothetical protein